MSVDLVDARQSPTDRDWLTNVYPFYLHDLSEFDDGYYRLSNDGRWEPDHLPSWLVDDTDYPFIIRTPRGRVGFALVNAAPSPHIMPGADYRLSEFFVLRAFRRTGVGRRAAFASSTASAGSGKSENYPAMDRPLRSGGRSSASTRVDNTRKRRRMRKCGRSSTRAAAAYADTGF
jgi:predicted acetyltransferase